MSTTYGGITVGRTGINQRQAPFSRGITLSSGSVGGGGGGMAPPVPAFGGRPKDYSTEQIRRNDILSKMSKGQKELMAKDLGEMRAMGIPDQQAKDAYFGPLQHSGWNTSGVGPGTRGYRGSYGGGYGSGYGRYGGYGGGDNGFRTKRPSASNSSEYYANRDKAIGNPIDMLKLHGPSRYGSGNIMQSLINEARGGASGGGGDDVWAKTRSPSDEERAAAGAQEASAADAISKAPRLPTGATSATDTEVVYPGSTTINTNPDGSKILDSPQYGTGSSIGASMKPRTDMPTRPPMEVAQEGKPPMIFKGYSPKLPSKIIRDSIKYPELGKEERAQGKKDRDEYYAVLNSLEKNATFTPAVRNISRAGQAADALALPIAKGAKIASSAVADPFKALYQYFFRPRPVPYR